MKPLEKLLIADDDEDILTIVRFSLEDIPDLSIQFCSSGQEAIQKAVSFQPELMILDIMMPDMDGLTFMKTAKLLPVLAKVPVVFMTAKIQIHEIQHYMSAGAIDVITKPFDPILLPEIIKGCWEKSQKVN